MRLLVDVGNSRIKWAYVEDGVLTRGGHLRRFEPIEDLLAAAWSTAQKPSSALICSVAGRDFDAGMGQWILARWGFRPDWFRTERETFGILNGYADYAQLGGDRWAALVGARVLHSGAVGVLDCGTAITLDVVDAGDRHLGGLLFPGPEIVKRSLLTNTAGIRQVAAGPTGVLGRSTAEGVTNGTSLGLAGAVERWMTDVEALVAGLEWIATGGCWPLLMPLIRRPVRYDADLVLRGLARMSEGGDNAC